MVIASDEFALKVKDIVKSYFPSAEFKEPKQAYELLVNISAFGLSETQVDHSNDDAIDCLHYSGISDNEDKEKSKEMAILDLERLRWLKQPKIIFWRHAEHKEDMDYYSGVTIHRHIVRFTLGY